jgi:hypothetical protein
VYSSTTKNAFKRPKDTRIDSHYRASGLTPSPHDNRLHAVGCQARSPWLVRAQRGVLAKLSRGGHALRGKIQIP